MVKASPDWQWGFSKISCTGPSKFTLSFENMSRWLAYCPEVVPRLQGSHQSQDEISSLGRTQSAGDLPVWLALATGTLAAGTLATGLLYKEQCSVPLCCHPGWQYFFMIRSDVNIYRSRISELEFREHSDTWTWLNWGCAISLSCLLGQYLNISVLIDPLTHFGQLLFIYLKKSW